MEVQRHYHAVSSAWREMPIPESCFEKPTQVLPMRGKVGRVNHVEISKTARDPPSEQDELTAFLRRALTLAP
ncbi:uncharacterized protein EHS24_000062 [Apiotrichum porosum]|uniref:Uncharacterized protein n=1 Tax=Apiotrichum porosum TaxID=105984 RepID=A0A427Y8U7_9TREE|nr:uncharacterized protein EHS24_000062 [Apiotrichum porosum]RSH87552.1 hypothetical protein EHS24_000062 [Apiotrichum porosum]